MAKVGIMGAGSWGTAISWLLTNNGHEVTVWSIDAREVEMLDQEREHKTKLPGVRLQDTIRFTNVIDQAIQGGRMFQTDRSLSMWQRGSRRRR